MIALPNAKKRKKPFVFLFQEANKEKTFFFCFFIKKKLFFFTNAKVPEIEWRPKSIPEKLKSFIEGSTKKNFQETLKPHFWDPMHGVIHFQEMYQMHQNVNFRFSQTKCFSFFQKLFLLHSKLFGNFLNVKRTRLRQF